MLPGDLCLWPGGNTSASVSKTKRGESLDLERRVQLGTVLGCARLAGSPLVGALGSVFTPASFRECNAIDGDSMQSCQTRPVILNQRNGGLQGLLSPPPDQFAELRACEGHHGSCHASVSSQTCQSAPCANVSALLSTWG